MRIDGKAFAEAILSDLTKKVTILKEQGVTPTLAVILVGNDPGSLSYVKQKQKAAEKIGARLVLSAQGLEFSKKELQKLIEKYNSDPSVHGLIVQRPLPAAMGDCAKILNQIKPQKDVDGFVPCSPYEVPVAAAVLKILEEVHSEFMIHYSSKKISTKDTPIEFLSWLRKQNVVIVGRGKTAGKPITETLSSQGCKVTVVHSQTPDPKKIMQKADILISCVGKQRVVTEDTIKPGAILVSVGLSRDNEGKLHGDYEEDQIKDIAFFYTPTPGGVGPVNVACLMLNLVRACQQNTA